MTILLTMKKVDILQEWDVRMVQIIIMILQEISSPQNVMIVLEFVGNNFCKKFPCHRIFMIALEFFGDIFLQEISLP